MEGMQLMGIGIIYVIMSVIFENQSQFRMFIKYKIVGMTNYMGDTSFGDRGMVSDTSTVIQKTLGNTHL